MKCLPYIRAPLVLGFLLVSLGLPAFGVTMPGDDSKITWMSVLPNTLQVTIGDPGYNFAGVQIRTDRQVTAALESVRFNGVVLPLATFSLTQLDNSIWVTPLPQFQLQFASLNVAPLSGFYNPASSLQLDIRLGSVFSGGLSIPPALEVFLLSSQYGLLNSQYTGYTDTPEPSTFMLIGFGLLAAGCLHRKLRR